jgi:hypothetical protein
MANYDADSPTSKRISKAVRVAILSPSVLLFISAVRLLIIANYDPTTADAIASSTGVVGTLLGTLIPIVPAFLPLLTMVMMIFRKPVLLAFAVLGTVLVSPAYATPKEAWLETINQFSIVINAIKTSNPGLKRHLLALSWQHDRTSLIVGIVVVTLIAFDNYNKLLIRSYRNLWSDSALSRSEKIFYSALTTLGKLVAAAVFGVLFSTFFFFVTTIYHVPDSVKGMSAVASQPWMPSEEVVLKSGTKTFVGYTLNAGDIWFVFLQEKDRTLYYFPEDEVVSRTLCQLPGEQRANRSPLIKLINIPAPKVPSCPKES